LTLVSTKGTKKVFLTSNTKFNEIKNTKIELIVSPEFYWVRKFEIPVKTETQARHVLPTLFEDIVNENESLTYQVIKLEDNLFLCFAFNNKKIYEAIKKAMIPTSSIQALYFAQNECKEFNSFEVDNQKFMYTSDNILIKVPNNLLTETMDLNRVINSIKLSSFKLQIKLYNDVFNSKYYYSFYVIFGLLIVFNLVKYFSFNNEFSRLEEETQRVKQAYKLPASTIQTDAILKRYKGVVSQEVQKRDAISYILSNKKFNLKSLELDKNSINLEYLSADKNEVDNYLKREFKNVSSVVNSFVLKVSIKI